eukprot:m.98095 g.98095  ORF g.98095 m.98095 type:complete len:232 (-) comp8688_c0_seq2:1672-2367(-)
MANTRSRREKTTSDTSTPKVEKEISQIPEDVLSMTDAELVKAMVALGYVPGPMTTSSRSLYERIYVRLLKNKNDTNLVTTSGSDHGKGGAGGKSKSRNPPKATEAEAEEEEETEEEVEVEIEQRVTRSSSKKISTPTRKEQAGGNEEPDQPVVLSQPLEADVFSSDETEETKSSGTKVLRKKVETEAEPSTASTAVLEQEQPVWINTVPLLVFLVAFAFAFVIHSSVSQNV